VNPLCQHPGVSIRLDEDVSRSIYQSEKYVFGGKYFKKKVMVPDRAVEDVVNILSYQPTNNTAYY